MSTTNPWDDAASIYDEARPTYPDQLVDDLVTSAQLCVGGRLLEIGAGTGKATVLLAQRGFRVHCVEPGPNLAAILAEKCSPFPYVTVDIASFEDWTTPDAADYDLIFCAQAFNWLDPATRYERCHRLLRDGGHIGVFWYGDCIKMAWESEIVSSGLFAHPQVFDYQTEPRVDTETWVKVVESTSMFAALDEEGKTRAREEARAEVQQQGGVVTGTLDYRMFVAKKT